ncbi:hypothetical protein BGZ70_005605 [Mortierella alpina]|uniref:Uncharacterized protein n=1 Tax=Mortierella alpina TaxID=64518 RepID=A0A9P6JF69_MORAP|nr:hypothetical protein BGZ70_005605 [Mortierella alpina]
MARQVILLFIFVLGLVGLSYVDACEKACRGDPVTYLTDRYKTLLKDQTDKIKDPKTAALAKKQIPELIKKINGRNKVIDKTIFDTFRGPCANAPGQRRPDELCGSAKSIACFAPWGHRPKSVLQMVHDAVTLAVKGHYAPLSQQYPEVNEVVVRGLERSCPKNCQGWVGP